MAGVERKHEQQQSRDGMTGTHEAILLWLFYSSYSQTTRNGSMPLRHGMQCTFPHRTPGNQGRFGPPATAARPSHSEALQLLLDPVDENPDPRRKQPRVRIDHADRPLRGLEILEHGLQPILSDIRRDLIRNEVAETET